MGKDIFSKKFSMVLLWLLDLLKIPRQRRGDRAFAFDELGLLLVGNFLFPRNCPSKSLGYHPG